MRMFGTTPKGYIFKELSVEKIVVRLFMEHIFDVHLGHKSKKLLV